MSKTVHIEVVSNYSRTDWSIDGSTTYQPGDRVAYFDGSRNRIFVCINSNNSTTEPQNNPTDWAPAGSEKYPFLNIDSTSNMRAINSSEWIVHGRSSDTVNFLAEELGTWTADNPVGGNAVYIADGQGGTIILGDGRYAWDQPTYAMWWPSNCTIKAKNKQKAYIISSGTYWAGDNVTWKDVVIYCSNSHDNIPGGYGGLSHSLDSCLITQETPWGSLYPQKQEPSDARWTRVARAFNGGYIRNCVFDYQYRGPSYWFDFASGSTGIFENNTFYARVKHNQYSAIYTPRDVVFKNNIFYFKYLMDGHASQSFSIGLMITNGVNVLYLENDSNVDGTLTNNIPEGITIDPQFVDAGNSNFSLRPSSPLIGGVKEGNKTAQKHPDGVWVDHNHTSPQASYSYILDSGNGTNYSFSGDATGSDPELTVNTRDTLTFTNNTGGHPLAIFNSEDIEVSTESGGTTTFTPKYPDTYYYRCTVTGHGSMRGNIIVTNGTLGSYGNPFESYHDAIDAGYFDSKLTLLFKEGDHLMSWYPGTNYSNNPGISSAFSGGLYFIGENHNSRLTTGNNFTSFAAFYVGASLLTGSPQSQTPLNLENITIHINNTSSYHNRGLLSGCHWKSFSANSVKVTASLGGSINGNVFDYFSNSTPTINYEFNMTGCELNVPLSGNNGPGGAFLGGASHILYNVQGCTFTRLSGYSYISNYGPSPCMVSGAFSAANGSRVKNCIFYSNTGGEFSATPSINAGVFSSCIIHSTTDSFTKLPTDMDLNSTADPLLINTSAGSEDLRLRAGSVGIGGLAKEPTNVYYLQPDNPFNGDGSQKDASAMTADGDPGPFNEFKEIIAAGVPYGSTVIIVNGTYEWTQSFGRAPSSNVSAGTWYAYTLAGYNYVAETSRQVIFDAKLNPTNVFIYKPYGGTFPTNQGGAVGVFLDLDTTFTGVQFNNVIGSDNTTRNQIGSVSDSAGLGSCTFKNCQFLGHINTGGNSSYPWTGGGRDVYSSSMHWEGCEFSIAFDYNGGLLGGGDGMADDQYHGAWSWENCTFYIPVGLTTFNNRNAINGTYKSPDRLFGVNFSQTQRKFKNNILHIPGGSCTFSTSAVSKLPSIENNCFNGVSPGLAADPNKYLDQALQGNNLLDTDPLFIDPNNADFKLRPNSKLIGKGL